MVKYIIAIQKKRLQSIWKDTFLKCICFQWNKCSRHLIVKKKTPNKQHVTCLINIACSGIVLFCNNTGSCVHSRRLGLDTGVEKMAASAATASSPPGLCPNYAVVCSFLERYGALLDLPELTFPQLERYLQDTSSGRARKPAAGGSEDAERLLPCINDNGTELTC